MSKNPYIDPVNYFEGYNKSIERLKNNPESVELARLCYEVFVMNSSGKTLLKVFEDRYFKSRLVSLNSPNFDLACVHAEGLREFLRIIEDAITSHDQRIKAEVNKP